MRRRVPGDAITGGEPQADIIGFVYLFGLFNHKKDLWAYLMITFHVGFIKEPHNVVTQAWTLTKSAYRITPLTIWLEWWNPVHVNLTEKKKTPGTCLNFDTPS